MGYGKADNTEHNRHNSNQVHNSKGLAGGLAAVNSD
jgi:hypothetical protein